MKHNVAILGSTGSVGTTTLSVLSKNKNYRVKLLTANTNVEKVLSQSLKFNVKNVVIFDKDKYLKFKNLFKKNKIKLHFGLSNINKILNKKLDFTINAISGIDGLEPTLKIIPHTKNILIANKETIICGWEIISKKLKHYRVNFIPIDSEHYSIFNLIKYENKTDISKIILTASGGPFLNKTNKQISNIKPKFALKHPKWKMGKKISIDSSTMMNKIFELIEAKKIFNLKSNNISILIHPASFVHAIVYFKGDLIKMLAHETKMDIPIANALGIKKSSNEKYINLNLKKIDNLKFEKPDFNKFPLLSIIKIIPEDSSYFETILITLNDALVKNYLNKDINYVSIQKNLLSLIKKPFLSKFYKLKPKTIYDIKNMINITNNYLKMNIKYYDK